MCERDELHAGGRCSAGGEQPHPEPGNDEVLHQIQAVGLGQRYLSGGPGAVLHVPPGLPHAFANTSGAATRVLFQSSVPAGDNYFDELAEVLRAGRGHPDPAAVADLRRRYDIEQLIALRAQG